MSHPNRAPHAAHLRSAILGVCAAAGGAACVLGTDRPTGDTSILATETAAFHDTFTGADGTSLPAHRPDVGTGWVEILDSSAGADARLAGGAAAAGSSQNDAGQAYEARPGPAGASQTVSFRLAALDTSSGTKPMGVFARRVDGDNFYYLQLLPNAHAEASLQLYKRAAGRDTRLGQVDDAIARGDTIMLAVTATAQQVLVNGALRIGAADASAPGAGAWGLYFGSLGGGHGGHLRTSWRVDELLAADGGGGGPACGDGACAAGEDCVTCATDCGECPGGPTCGDGTCGPGEDLCSCGADCGDHCGDGVQDCDEDGTDCGGTRCAACPAGGSAGLWIARDEVLALPTSGRAWDNLLADANRSTASPDIANQDDLTDSYTFAKALVWVRTGQARYRDEVVRTIRIAMGTEDGGRTLALARNLTAYVIAADLVGLDGADDAAFRAWLSAVRTEPLSGRTLVSTHEDRPNNWGAHAGAARIAAALYLGDAADLERAVHVHRGYLGDRAQYAGFTFGDLSWQCDPTRPVGINPSGCARAGHVIDGVLPDDQRRAGGFSWPPPEENYVYEALQGVVVTSELLRRQGYPAWEWQDRAVLRAFRWLHETSFQDGDPFHAQGDDVWEIWVVNRRAGTHFPAATGVAPGKSLGYTDWTHR